MPERGEGRYPADDFAERRVALVGLEQRRWYRAAIQKSATGDWLTWDRRASSRFSHPDSPYPVLYLGDRTETCFWEAFGDDLLDTMPGIQPMVSEAALKERHFVRFDLPAELRVFDTLDGSALKRIGADNNTFKMPYGITQAWARALMSHPSQPDGLLYESRLTPSGRKRCLALFGRDKVARQGMIKAQTMGPMLDDNELLEMFVEQGIGF